MKRTMHYLKTNAKCESPSNILCIDTEAKIEEKENKQFHTLRLGFAIHLSKSGESKNRKNVWSHTSYEIHTPEDFHNLLDSLIKEKRRLYVYAHNMAYDYTLLKIDSYLSKREMKISTRVIDPVFIIKSRNVIFLSSTNYYRMSLRELGKIFKMEKTECPDFKNVSDDVLMAYCKNDTEVLAHLIKEHINFILKNNLGSFKTTIAGQALGAFRHRFMKDKILIHTYDDILKMEIDSYHGGRCEAFFIGKKENIYKLDVNSMYPFIMKNKSFPIKPIFNRPIENLSVENLKEAIEQGLFLLIDCDIEINKPFIACKREKLFFPIGKISQVLTNPEIEYILNHPENGKILNIKKAVIYKSSKIFSDYVDFFYELKINASNPAIETMAKLFLNSLYGKFGQRASTIPKLVYSEEEKNLYLNIMKENKTFVIFNIDDNSKYIKLGDMLYHIIKEIGDLARDSSPIIASAVTSYARIYLFELIEIAGSNNVFYCDTDSLFVSETGFKNLEKAGYINKKELGKLKIEEIGNVEINGPKSYIFNEQRKLKGIKKDALLLPNGSYEQWQFQTKNIKYRNGTEDGIVILAPIIKTISNKYDKGIVGSDGTISPLCFNEWGQYINTYNSLSYSTVKNCQKRKEV